MAQLADLSEGLENRLYRASREACSLEQLYAAVKSKRYPLARVLARVDTQLKIKAAADFLRDQNDFLEQEVQRRT